MPKNKEVDYLTAKDYLKFCDLMNLCVFTLFLDIFSYSWLPVTSDIDYIGISLKTMED